MSPGQVAEHGAPPASVAAPADTKKTKKKRNRRRNSNNNKQGTGDSQYGQYNCPDCKKRWGHMGAAADVPEPCSQCKKPVLPRIMPPRQGLTPYQGYSRCFGTYQCHKCMKSWSSGNSWADMSQQCKDCLVKVYPHTQRPLLGRSQKNKNKPHLEHFCEKCKTLGTSCVGRARD